MPNAPKVVVFDLGGVLVSFDETPLYAVLRPEVDHAAWWAFVLHHPVFRGFETGTIATEAMAAVAVRELCRAEVDVPSFIGQLSRWPEEPFPGARACVQRVRNAGVPTVMLSNTNPLHWTILRPKFADLFDQTVLSFETGFLKPDPKAFAAAEERTGRSAHEILFFDDNPHNVAESRARGWQAVQVRGPSDIHAALDAVNWPA